MRPGAEMLRTIALSLVVSTAGMVGCTPFMLAPGQSVLLAGEHANELADQCSRPGPGVFDATWEPSGRDLEVLEERLPVLHRTRSRLCCLSGATVPNVNDYYRQYVGIVIRGRKLIYVNAFAADEPPRSWREEPVGYCDGGTGAWGVLFDPQTGMFEELAFNGLA